jgi:hypothetical protein
MIPISIVLLHHLLLLLFLFILLLVKNFIYVSFLLFDSRLSWLIKMSRRLVGLLLFDGSFFFIGLFFLATTLLLLYFLLTLLTNLSGLFEDQLFEFFLLADHFLTLFLYHLLL